MTCTERNFIKRVGFTSSPMAVRQWPIRLCYGLW